jgi:hypothetical protein
VQVKVLNLDELAKPRRKVTVLAVDYEVREMSVEGFIEYSRKARENEARAKQDPDRERTPEDDVQSMVDTVRLAVPDLPEAVLKRLSLIQLTTLIEFINGLLDDEAAGDGKPVTEGADSPQS